MEITGNSSLCAPMFITRGSFVKLLNHPRSLLLNVSWHCMVSIQDPGFFVWIKEVNFGVHITYVTSAAAGYAMEPTGSNVASENGKVERPNSTFGAMVHCILYSSCMSAIFWSYAFVH
jgi:hypothetical protein